MKALPCSFPRRQNPPPKMETPTTAVRELPTWKIVTDAEKNFHWSFSCHVFDATSEGPDKSRNPLQNPLSSLPSMSQLLLQGSSKIFGEVGHTESGVPMFRTGSGKSVAVKQSSIRKALSVLEGLDMPERDQVQNHSADQGCSFSNSFFQTGSGKMVNISPGGLIRAKTLLGLEEKYNFADHGPEDTEKPLGASGWNECWKSQCLENNVSADFGTENMQNIGSLCPSSIPRCPTILKGKYSHGSQTEKGALPKILESNKCRSSSKSPPFKFQTAGGRSLSVSSDALQRARSLLGDTDLAMLPNDNVAYDPLFSFLKNDKTSEESFLNKENICPAFENENAAVNGYWANTFPSCTGSLFNQKQSSSLLEGSDSRSGIMKHVDTNGFAAEGIHRLNNNIFHKQRPPNSDLYATHMSVENCSVKDLSSRKIPLGRSSSEQQVEISNNVEAAYANQKQIAYGKRRFGRSSLSPFKRPRSSRFSTPLGSGTLFPSIGSSNPSTSEGSCCKMRVSTRYPFQIKRRAIKEFFGGPPYNTNRLRCLPDEVKCMNADNAENYIFRAASGFEGIGVEALHCMLAQSGASSLHATKEWVSNHYKWIVWKLACLERGYPAQAHGKFLTVANVLEELKYRYEREVNHGHRSAIKRILEGDTSPASMVVLCISAIHSYPASKLEKVECSLPLHEDGENLSASNGAENSLAAKIVLTDGWYSLDAVLDAQLSKQLVAGKLFVGQKLRIWGARLHGWVASISPLEAHKTATLLLHINGTYRTHWADRLGFCKEIGAPLAFRCIKSAGGPVPRTLVGVTRIYPILYKEKLTGGDSVVRSERLETLMSQAYNQRCYTIAEGIMFEAQKDIFVSHVKNDSDDEEGAKIFKLLETADEPEVLMADMSSEQLMLFATYQAKREAAKQSDLQKKIERALIDAGLSGRHVTPLLRLRVVGLTAKCSQRKDPPREGLITIWNPTEQQVTLVEGQIYCVEGLLPLYSHSNIVYLQARGSTTIWRPLPQSATESFQPFFTPRKSISLSNLGEVPLASEFDTAAVVVYVGDVYFSGNQKKQWVFATDGSESESGLKSGGPSNCLLAVCFCSSITGNDAYMPVNQSIAGSTGALTEQECEKHLKRRHEMASKSRSLGFCNLVKRGRDPVNDFWVADTTENSAYYLSYDLYACSHLKGAAGLVRKWAENCPSVIQKLNDRVLHIVGVRGS